LSRFSAYDPSGITSCCRTNQSRLHRVHFPRTPSGADDTTPAGVVAEALLKFAAGEPSKIGARVVQLPEHDIEDGTSRSRGSAVRQLSRLMKDSQMFDYVGIFNLPSLPWNVSPLSLFADLERKADSSPLRFEQSERQAGCRCMGLERLSPMGQHQR